MKLALINPKGSSLSQDREFKEFWENSSDLDTYKFLWSGFSIGLLTIAALTPKSFDDIDMIDENFDSINFNKKYNLVGISAMTQQILRAYFIADKFRQQGIKVVIGGIHATVLPKEVKDHADAVLIGEAEEIWPKLIEDFNNDQLKPFYKNEKPPNLKKTPVPRYELLNKENYKTIWVQTTRGCPHNCEFCAASKIYGKVYRTKLINKIIEEIKLIKKIWQNPQISFADDNMFVNKEFSIKLLKEIKKFNIRWLAQTDISISNDDRFLSFLKDCGCKTLFIGFESIIGKSLFAINSNHWKFKYLKYYPKAIEKIQSKGIGVIGAFIIGFDTDDHTVFKKTTKFILDNKLYGAQVSILTPLPGTKLRERLESEGRVISNNWSKYTAWDVNFLPAKLKADELQEGILEVNKIIYSKKVKLETAKHFKDIYTKLQQKIF